MLKRYAPPKRSTKPLKRTPLKRPTKRIPQQGRVGKRKEKARADARAQFFAKHPKRRCQWCWEPMGKTGNVAHHKKPRGEGGPDTLENMVVIHADCHDYIHARGMGRPQGDLAAAIFRAVELSEANAVNGQRIQWEND